MNQEQAKSKAEKLPQPQERQLTKEELNKKFGYQRNNDLSNIKRKRSSCC